VRGGGQLTNLGRAARAAALAVPLLTAAGGRVATGSSGEIVELRAWDCGTNDFRVLGTARTRTGGLWELQNPSATPPYPWTAVGSGTKFRARWRQALSRPVFFRAPATITAWKVRGRRAWSVHVRPEPNERAASLAGKVVELQRRVGSRWRTYERAKLVHRVTYALGPYNHEATFSVPRSGLRLRALLAPYERRALLPALDERAVAILRA
jgi:hypothetical protein